MRLPNIKDIVRDAKDKRAREELAAIKRPDELTRLHGEVARLKLALRALYDNQNGPPLLRCSASWEKAHEAAGKLLKELEPESED